MLHGYRAGSFRWITAPGSASFRFADDGPVVGVPLGETSAGSLRDLWLRSVLPLVVQARGTEVLHASGIAVGSRVVALCGRSTAGKSTVAASFVDRRGHDVVADDALPFTEGERTIHAFGLPFELRPRTTAPALSGTPLARRPRFHVRRRLRLGAVVILEPAGEGVILEKLTPAAAFGVLMPHAYCFTLDEGKERLIRRYASLASGVPVYELAYPQVPEALDEMIGALEGLLRD